MIKLNKIFLIFLFLFIFTSCFIILSSFLKIIIRYQLPNLSEPEINTYRSDEMIFLKTFYLMKKEKNYYMAFKEANEGDIRGRVMTEDVFTWRLPTLFYFWHLTANNGGEILRNFWLFIISTLFAVFLILRKFINYKLACLGIILLLPYFSDSLIYKTSFLFTEWWAWFLLIIGLTFWFYQKIIPAWIFFILTAAVRELMMIPILFFFLYSLYLKRYRFFFFSIIFLFIIFLLFHYKWIYSHLDNNKIISFNLSSQLSRIHAPEKLTVQRMVAFSMRQYPLVKNKSHIWLIILSFISLLINLLNEKKNNKIYYLFIVSWGLFFVLPFITSSQYNDYWGILFMPTLILTIPLIFSKNV